MAGPGNISKVQLLENAVLKYVTKTFDEGDWIELGIETGTLDLIQGHDRLLRALSWDDPDYAKHAVTVVKQILNTLRDDEVGAVLDITEVDSAFPNFKLWAEVNSPSLYQNVYLATTSPPKNDEVSNLAGPKPSTTPFPVNAGMTVAPTTTKTTDKVVSQPNVEENHAAALPAAQTAEPKNKIFIVHGHDHELRNEVYIFLGKVTGLNPVILDFEASGGMTLIEKFEAHSASSTVAVVLLTPDDIGAAKSSPDNLEARARQNVVFEMGFFVGALSRSKVIIIHDDIELPSDLKGLVYVPRSASNWYERLRRELTQAGVKLIG